MAAEAQDTSVLRFPSIVLVIFGLVLIFFFLVGCLLSVQTTEAWILHWKARATPDATIIMQIPQFFDGSLQQDVTIAFCIGFGIQLILLITKIGLPAVHAIIARKHAGKPITKAMEKSAKTRMNVWGFGQFSCLAINAWADLLYSWHLSWWVAFIFSGVMFLMTFYFGTWGIHFISAGMTSDDR